MVAIKKPKRLPVEEYLAAELASPIKHEYLGGVIYNTARARNAHNDVAGKVFGALYVRLRGKPCRPRNSDTKIRIRLASHTRFYYPDASVVCKPNPPTDSFQDEPAVIVEVLSRRTRRIDEGEKRDAYLSIPSLSVYLLVEHELSSVVAYRRTDQGFVREEYDDLDATVLLPEIGAALSLGEIYEDVEFTPEPGGE